MVEPQVQTQTVSLQASLQVFLKMMQDKECTITLNYAMPLGDLAKAAVGILNGDLVVKTRAEMEQLVPKPPSPK